MFNIDYEKLHSLESAFVIYEIASHGVDPRETVEGTTFRIYEREGYKQQLYDEIHGRIENGGPYVDIANDALKNNLVDYHQKLRIADLLESDSSGVFEEALSSLYAGNDDEAAFKDIVDAFGGNFDERFRILGVEAGLAGNCTWKKYQEYNETIKAIQEDLNKHINEDITFLDAHKLLINLLMDRAEGPFVWEDIATKTQWQASCQKTSRIGLM